jgi:hypothetical protein
MTGVDFPREASFRIAFLVAAPVSCGIIARLMRVIPRGAKSSKVVLRRFLELALWAFIGSETT